MCQVVSFRALKNKLVRGTGAEAQPGLLAQSTAKAWNAITSQTLQASQLHQALADRLCKGAATTLAKATLAAHTRRKDVEKSAQRVQKDLRDARRRLQRALDVANEIEKQPPAPSTPPTNSAARGAAMFGAFFKKTSTMTPEAAEIEHAEAQRRCHGAQEVYDTTLPACVEQLQDTESQRLATTKLVLSDYMQSSQDCLKALLALFPPALHLASVIDADLDLEKTFDDGGGQVW